MNQPNLKILLVEDEPVYAGLLQEILTSATGAQFDVTHVTQCSDALRELESGRFDVVLLDLTLPDRHGLQTYEHVHARAPSAPIVVLTAFDDEQLALQAVREGAQDYLVKGQFDARMLARTIRYAIERKRAAEALRQSEQFFRLISENVSDLIAVIDQKGRRLYNSPSYKNLLGDPARLVGTDSFEEIHPEDRERVKRIFRQTLDSGIGTRTEYRMVLKDGSVRYIESQGSTITDDHGNASKLVVVSRDITERIEAVAVLRQALSDLKESHENLKTAQRQLIQSEKLEAVSTFAAGVAHEVKNPLQTVILGVDYLSSHLPKGDGTAAMILTDMSGAVMRADGIIRGLLEFSSTNNRKVEEEDLSWILEQALRAVEQELVQFPITLAQDLAQNLPLLRLDGRTIRHVFIHLFMHAIRELASGGTLEVRTFVRTLTEEFRLNGRRSGIFKPGETLVGASVEEFGAAPAGEKPNNGPNSAAAALPIGKEGGLGLTVLKKIIELYGGVIEVTKTEKGNQYIILFKALSGQPPPKPHDQFSKTSE